MLDKRQKIILFVGSFLFFGMFLNIRGVNAEYIPCAEAPVDVGDVLIYDVQYNISGNSWEGYYKFVITEISIDTEHYGTKLIKSSWYSSEDNVNWNLNEQEMLVGKISLNEVYFEENTLFHHRYFGFDFKPDSEYANETFEDFIYDVYDLSTDTTCYDDTWAMDISFSNATWSSTHNDGWRYRYGILTQKEINLSEFGSSDVFEINWYLLLDDCSIAKLGYNYWGIPNDSDASFKVGDYFVYNWTSIDQDGTMNMKARMFLTDCNIHDNYLLYLYSMQQWDSEAESWVGSFSDTCNVEYTLTLDVYRDPNNYCFDYIIPYFANLSDPDYVEYLEGKMYWENHNDDSETQIYEILDDKCIETNRSHFEDEVLLTDYYRFQNFSYQGYLTEMISYSESSISLFSGSTISLILEESAITPEAPIISLENLTLTENTTTINWDEIFDALEYNVYLNDTLVGTTTDCSYELEFDEFGDYNVTVTGVCNSRESDISNPLVISYSKAPDEPNTNSDPEPDDPSVPGMSAWMIGLFSIIVIATMYRITKNRIEME